jgi:hypothetical protein
MAKEGRAVTAETLGAWLLKSSPSASPVDEFVRTDFATVTNRCIRPSYRADEVAAGQPVLFWISGDDKQYPAGIYAQGHTTGPAQLDMDQLVMQVRLTSIDPPVLRRELLEHPRLSQLEVIRMAAGSNPSFLTRDQLRELERLYPQVGVGSR